MDYIPDNQVVWNTTSDYKTNENFNNEVQTTSGIPLMVTVVFALLVMAFWKRLGVR